MISLLKLVLISLTVLKSQSKAQNIVFKLLDSEVNEVIFVGERDIVLNCSVRCVTNAVITIKRGELLMAKSDRNDGYLEYNIDEVLLGDNGNYTCTVSYFDVNSGKNKTEMKTLHLNVKEVRPQCFRNGTEGESFQVGDLLLMSCYCLEDDGCRWIGSIVEAGQAMLLGPVFETIAYRGKKIQRILEEYTMSTDMNIRYDCFRPIGQSSVFNFCSIGPQIQSSNDTIVNNVPFNDKLSRQDGGCDLFQSTSVSNLKLTTEKASYQYMVTTNSNSKVIDRGNALLIPISLGTSGFIVIFILTVVIMCIMRWWRQKNKLGNKIEHQYFNAVHSSNKSYNQANTVKDTDTYYHHIRDPDERENDVCSNVVCPISEVNGTYEYKLPTTDETFQIGKMFEKEVLDIHTDPNIALGKNKSQNGSALSVPPKDASLSRGSFESHVENRAVYSFHLYTGDNEKNLNLKRNVEADVCEDDTSERKEMQSGDIGSEIYAEVNRSLGN